MEEWGGNDENLKGGRFSGFSSNRKIPVLALQFTLHIHLAFVLFRSMQAMPGSLRTAHSSRARIRAIRARQNPRVESARQAVNMFKLLYV
jgi:hypothetical protein